VEDAVLRRLTAKDLGLLPRRDTNGTVLQDGPEILYEELEDALLASNTSVYNPHAIIEEYEIDTGDGEQLRHEVSHTEDSDYRILYMFLILFLYS